MIALVSHPITKGKRKAEIKVIGHTVAIKCLDKPIEFVCEPAPEIDEWLLNWLFSEKHSGYDFGLNDFTILSANVPIVQSESVKNREFVESMKKRYKK